MRFSSASALVIFIRSRIIVFFYISPLDEQSIRLCGRVVNRRKTRQSAIEASFCWGEAVEQEGHSLLPEIGLGPADPDRECDARSTTSQWSNAGQSAFSNHVVFS